MGICLVFTVLFLLSSFIVVNHCVYRYAWNVAHTTQWCNPWRTFSRSSGGLLGLTTFWCSSSWILFSGNLNQTLIFTPCPWWQLDSTPLTSREKVKRGKKGKRHLAASVSGLLGVLLSLKLDVESQAEMESELIVFVFWELIPNSQLGFFAVGQKPSQSQSKYGWAKWEQ